MQLKHLRDQREGLTEQLAAAARSRDDRERQLSEAHAEQLASVTAELSRAQALLRDREQAAGASERLQVWVCGWVDEGKVGQCWLGGEGFADEWGGGHKGKAPLSPLLLHRHTSPMSWPHREHRACGCNRPLRSSRLGWRSVSGSWGRSGRPGPSCRRQWRGEGARGGGGKRLPVYWCPWWALCWYREVHGIKRVCT